MNAPNKHSNFDIEVSLPGTKGLVRPLPASLVDEAATEFVVLLLPGFSQLCLSSLIDPLRLANDLSGRKLFSWRLVSRDGKPVECASGISIGVSGNIFGADALDLRTILMICAGDGVERQGEPRLRAVLRRCARASVQIYALGTAAWLLADAALLGDARCTIHWGRMAALSETFADLAIHDALFVRDGRIVTCAGGFAAFDLAAELIQERCGAQLVRDICQHLTADRWRDGASCQSAPPGLRYGGAGKKLLPIIQLMERHLEDLLPLEEISLRVSLSRRQMERLFERHLSTTPWQHYLALRLAKARQLIELTDMAIMDVAVACGFVSSSHFSKTFRDRYSALPSELRESAATDQPRRALAAQF
ncbi:GlxA family transcriptional regulator [Aminobacter sp. P9b]|uniref:GlxA family transcriptional regulator n=1 Tax=Aminobacter sp. P9b TaxID=3133697 RepID=UPI003249F91D